MPNPRAQKPLSYEQIIKDAKSLGVPAQALLDALAGGVKGSVSATVGAPADIYNLINQASFRGQLPTAPYGSEDISKMLPDVVPTEDKSRKHSAEYGETMGSFIPTPMAGQALKGAVKLGAKGARALGEGLGQLSPSSSGPRTLYSQVGAIKPKGGNWLEGSVEKSLEDLKTNKTAHKQLEEMRQVYPPEEIIRMSPETRATVERAFPHLENQVALNNWVDKNLTNYVKNEMGTPEDPVRLGIENRTKKVEADYAKEQAKIAKLDNKIAQAQQVGDQGSVTTMQATRNRLALDAENTRELAEKNISHSPLEAGRYRVPENIKQARFNAGFPTEGMGQSDLAKAWEHLSDASIKPQTVEQLIDPRWQKEGNVNSNIYQAERNKANNPWLEKLDPKDVVHETQHPFSGLGFDHILDVLKEDVASGRLRPESLKNVSMEQAVQRTIEYNIEMAKKMAEAQFKITEGMPVHKEYPEGYKWIELTAPKENSKRLSEIDTLLNANRQGGEYGVDWLRGANGEKEYFVTKGSGRNTVYMDKFPTEEEAIARGKELSGQQIDVDALRSEREGLTKEAREKMLENALKYEGDTMGHCVGGYCPDVLEGRSRIYSLRDKKGEPHVTVETNPSGLMGWQEIKRAGGDPLSVQTEAKRRMGITPEAERELTKSWDGTERARQQALLEQNMHDIYVEQFGEPPQNIIQIKGKQNLAPKEQYLPYVQDFVKSGNWGDVGDLHNTGLRHSNDAIGEEAMQALKDQGIEVPKYVTQEEAIKMSSDAMNNIGKYPPPVEGMKQGGAVHISDNPDAMYMELMDRKFAGGGAIAKLTRALAKKPEEIKAIAERMAPQVIGEEFIRGKQGTQSIAGKTQKQFAREKELEHDIRPTKELPEVKPVDLAEHKGKVMIGIAGDPSIAHHEVHAVAGSPLSSPSPQHGGPFYGRGNEPFWASGLGAANRVQNLAREASGQYGNADVLGNYMMMPEGLNYAQHFADANLSAINPSKMTKAQIEGFNDLLRKGSNKSGPRENFPGIEDQGSAYLWMSQDPELRKYFNALMQQPTVTEKFGLPSGKDVAHAITEPDLRNLETGVTGKSLGLLRPEVTNLERSMHPTYSHDIPGEFLGSTSHPIPYELSFPDMMQSIRNNPSQAPQEFGSLKMVGPRQIIDQQLIDEIGEYQRRMKELTGKKKGGAIKKAKGGEISEDDIQMEVRPL